jgi:ketosteroid isomerase-like protein
MKAIEKAIEDLRLAMINADHAELERLTAEELSYGHTSGLIEDKKDFIQAIGGRDHFKTITITDLTIREANGLAIVRHRFQSEVFINGALAQPDIRVLQVWRQQDGKWKLIARQAYKI